VASGVALHGDTTAHFWASSHATQWRNDGVAAASSDGDPTGGRGPPTVLEFQIRREGP